MTTTLTTARQMIGADFLKLRRKRGTIAWSLLLAAGSVIVYFLWNAIQHGSDPAAHAPAGGMDGFKRALEVIGVFMGPLAAVLIGAEAGAGDHSAGVFRDLVVTGRSRVALFASRVPAALLLTIAVTSVGYAFVIAGTFVFAGGQPTPDTAMLLNGFGWALLVNGAVCLVAVGLASLTTSKPATITALIGFELVASPILLQTSSLGAARKALLDASVLKLAPALTRGAPVIAESLLVARVAIAVWSGAALGLGAWRTRRMDA